MLCDIIGTSINFAIVPIVILTVDERFSRGENFSFITPSQQIASSVPFSSS